MWSPTLSVMKPTVLATSAPRVWIASPISGLSTTSAREPPCPIANKSDGMLVDADRQLAAPGWRRRALPDRAVPATSRGRGRLSGARARFSNGAGGGGRGFDSPLSPFLFFLLLLLLLFSLLFLPSFSSPFLLPPCPRFCFFVWCGLFGVGCLVVLWCGLGWVVWVLCGLRWVGFCGCGLFGGVCVLFVGVVVWFVPSCVCLRVLCMFPVCLLWCEF